MRAIGQKENDVIVLIDNDMAMRNENLLTSKDGAYRGTGR